MLSKELVLCLKLVQQQLKISCSKEQKGSASGINKFWIVESSDEVLSMVETVNGRNVVADVGSIDFSTLFTSIEHKSLIKEISWAVRKAFKDSGRKKMAVYKASAKWVNHPREGTKTLDAEDLIKRI